MFCRFFCQLTTRFGRLRSSLRGNCSICRRLGALWAHADIDKIKVSYDEAATIGYCQGDKTLMVRSCKTCGCTTHWEPLDPEKTPWMALNCNMAKAGDIEGLPIRLFDGAESWAYLE